MMIVPAAEKVYAIGNRKADAITATCDPGDFDVQTEALKMHGGLFCRHIWIF
ncbi:MAG: hypothetical protein IJ719_21580 [Clostridia bacterium]|nr:hypothetical protein [Clostridia bacterium]